MSKKVDVDDGKVRTVNFDAVPEYAVVYMAYGDSSGLSDEDVGIIDKWMAAKNLDHLVDCGEERFFSSHPEFGLAADCVEATFMERSRASEKKAAVFARDEVGSRRSPHRDKGTDALNRISADGEVQSFETSWEIAPNSTLRVKSISFLLVTKDRSGYSLRIPCVARGESLVRNMLRANVSDGSCIRIIGSVGVAVADPTRIEVSVEDFQPVSPSRSVIVESQIKPAPFPRPCGLVLEGTVDTDEGHYFRFKGARSVPFVAVHPVGKAGLVLVNIQDQLAGMAEPYKDGEHIRIRGGLSEQGWWDSNKEYHTGLFVRPETIERVQERKPEKKQGPAVARDSGGWEY